MITSCPAWTLPWRLVFLVGCCGVPAGGWAQSFCASDGQPRPAELLERFISADCEACWRDPATVQAAAQQAVLDWVTPGNRGDEAPLAAAAVREGLGRLTVAGQPGGTPAASSTLHKAKSLPGRPLRVAHGLALSGYIGVSIEFKPRSRDARQPLSAWLALVENIPAGIEGSPVPRKLVRSVLQLDWDGRAEGSGSERSRFYETRVMQVAEGVDVNKLGVIGWIEDARGGILAIAQSACH